MSSADFSFDRLNCTELMPGDVGFGQQGDAFFTLLGSCVSVILTDPRRTVAALSHVVHAGSPRTAQSTTTAYGDVAMAELFNSLQRAGLNPRQCEAMLFGGGNMFPQQGWRYTVGDRNIDWARGFLSAQGIPVVRESVGGVGYRRLSWVVGPHWPHIETGPAAEGA